MEDHVSAYVKKVRKALDDILPTGVTDSFSNDVDDEIAQALEQAAISLTRQLPLEMLETSIIKTAPVSPTWARDDDDNDDGSGIVKLPTDFLRFVSLKISSWKGTVTELMEPGSEAAMQQRSTWSRGSVDKPKAMFDTDTDNSEDAKVIRYWPKGSSDTTKALVYVKKAAINSTTNKLKCALNDEAEKNLIYLTCRIFLEGKKEHAAADKFAQLVEL